MDEIRRICAGERIIWDNRLGFSEKEFQIQGISSGIAGNSVERGPGERGTTVVAAMCFSFL